VTAKVVDASAFAAASFYETEAINIGRRLAGHELHAPHLLRTEMINVCLKKIRTYPDQRDLLIEQHRQSLGLQIQEHGIDPQEVLRLAASLKLSAYDASYLWLARVLGAELVTLDDKLQKAAAKP
jgi:predicted nucleic acid-binding protein